MSQTYDRKENIKRIRKRGKYHTYMIERKIPNTYDRKKETKHMFTICTKNEKKIPPNRVFGE